MAERLLKASDIAEKDASLLQLFNEFFAADILAIKKTKSSLGSFGEFIDTKQFKTTQTFVAGKLIRNPANTKLQK